MNPTELLDGNGDLGAGLCDAASARGWFGIWRAQSYWRRTLLVRDGVLESAATESLSGHALQVLDDSGSGALVSRDGFDASEAREMTAELERLLRHAPALGLSRAVIPEVPSEAGREIPWKPSSFEGYDTPALVRLLRELEAEVAAPDLRMRIGFTMEVDGWRIRRTGGTDVTFVMPRCSIRLAATAPSSAGPPHTVGVAAAGPKPEDLFSGRGLEDFRRRARWAVDLVRRLPDAPLHAAGSFPVVMDYALAKGLAHEAFGHASEADGFRSSVLARDGRFRAGDRVGANHVSIVDEPLEGDHAWQPYSANGVRRRAARIVDKGVLAEALADIWTAGPGGVPLTGAARAETYRHAPLPRMSNIRIEVEGAQALDASFETLGPEDVRELLHNAGVFRRHPEVVYLSGYSGGQVNPATGDFVFNCKALYRLGAKGVRLYRPAIFSGSMFGALESIREAFGPLRLDALGTCGKWGQRVPSSGGSHYFLVLEPHPSVRLGGGS